MGKYIIGYSIPGSMGGGSGRIEYESASRAGSKGNLQDARMALVEKHGNTALQWVLDGKPKKAKG